MITAVIISLAQLHVPCGLPFSCYFFLRYFYLNFELYSLLFLISRKKESKIRDFPSVLTNANSFVLISVSLSFGNLFCLVYCILSGSGDMDVEMCSFCS